MNINNVRLIFFPTGTTRHVLKGIEVGLKPAEITQLDFTEAIEIQRVKLSFLYIL